VQALTRRLFSEDCLPRRSAGFPSLTTGMKSVSGMSVRDGSQAHLYALSGVKNTGDETKVHQRHFVVKMTSYKPHCELSRYGMSIVTVEELEISLSDHLVNNHKVVCVSGLPWLIWNDSRSKYIKHPDFDNRECSRLFVEPGSLKQRQYEALRPYFAGNRSDPSLSGTPMGFAALYPSYPKTTGCRMG
jgi:hypothetical protein